MFKNKTKTPERRHSRRPGVAVVTFENILHFVLLLLIAEFEQIKTSWRLYLRNYLKNYTFRQ